jgi:uncharacterized protein
MKNIILIFAIALCSINLFGQSKLDAKAIEAAKDSETEKMLKLLDKGASVEASDEYGNTLLMHCASRNNLFGIVTLIKHGANCNVRNKAKSTPLINGITPSWAAIKICETLINCGTEINALNSDNESALYKACDKKNWDVAELLVKNGANANLGKSPLIPAINHEGIVQLLLKNGADPNYKDKKNRSVLQYAVIKGNKNSINLLMQFGCKDTLPTNVYKGMSPFELKALVPNLNFNVYQIEIAANAPEPYTIHRNGTSYVLHQGKLIDFMNDPDDKYKTGCQLGMTPEEFITVVGQTFLTASEISKFSNVSIKHGAFEYIFKHGELVGWNPIK